MNLQHDIPTQNIRGRRARISAVDPDNPHNVWVAFRGERGSPEPAYWAGSEPLSVSQDVRVTAEPELKRWKVEAGPTGKPTITLSKVWVFGAANHTDLAVSPNGKYLLTAQGTSLKSLNWEAETVDDTEVVSSNIRSIAVSPSGAWVAVAVFASPFIKVYAFDQETGAIGAAVSDPASLPPSFGDKVRWHPREAAIYINTGTNTDPIVAYPWLGSSFGTKVFPPGLLTGWGSGPSFDEEYFIIRQGVQTRAASLVGGPIGFAVHPTEGCVVANVEDVDSDYFYTLWQFAIDEIFDPDDAVFGGRLDSFWTHDNLTSFFAGFPEFSNDGTLIAWANQGASNVASGSFHSSEVVVTGFSTVGGFSFEDSPPRSARRSIKFGQIDDIRRAMWRPNTPQNQLLWGVAPAIFMPGLEPRLILATYEGHQWQSEVTYEVDDENGDIWFGADTWIVWHPNGTKFFVLPDFYLTSGQRQIVVFSVT